MVKNLFLFLLLIITTGVFARSDRDAILKVMNDQEKAWNRGDLEAFMQGYWQSEQLKFIGKNGIRYGWQSTLENYQKSYADKAAMGQLRFDIINVELAGESAFVLGQWTLKRDKGDAGGYFTLYWKKIDGKWRITIDHSS